MTAHGRNILLLRLETVEAVVKLKTESWECMNNGKWRKLQNIETSMPNYRFNMDVKILNTRTVVGEYVFLRLFVTIKSSADIHSYELKVDCHSKAAVNFLKFHF